MLKKSTIESKERELGRIALQAGFSVGDGV